jgi:hypothetical protein
LRTRAEQGEKGILWNVFSGKKQVIGIGKDMSQQQTRKAN